MKSGNTSEKIATDIVNLALTIQNEKTKVFISGLTIRNDNLEKKTERSQSIFGSCPGTQNHLRGNKTISRNKINSGNSYPQVQQRRLKNPKNIILGHLNINSLRSNISKSTI